MLKLERIYTKPFDMDGYRLFVDRLWCRGISKQNAKVDKWFKDIAPSTKLRKWFKHVDAKYPKFKKQYINELNNNPKIESFLTLVKNKLSSGNLILLYGAKNGHHNNATVLRNFINDKLNLNVKPRHDFKDFLYNDSETNKTKDLKNDAKFLIEYPQIAKEYDLRAGDNGKIYHGSNKKALDHLDLSKLCNRR